MRVHSRQAPAAGSNRDESNSRGVRVQSISDLGFLAATKYFPDGLSTLAGVHRRPIHREWLGLLSSANPNSATCIPATRLDALGRFRTSAPGSGGLPRRNSAPSSLIPPAHPVSREHCGRGWPPPP